MDGTGRAVPAFGSFRFDSATGPGAPLPSPRP